MITAFQIYIVVQMDMARNALLMLFFATFGITLVFAFQYALIKDGVVGGIPEDANQLKRVSRALRNFVGMLVFVGMGLMVLPSSKTAAAMLVLPALTSDEVVKPVGRELRELYGLAKAALQNMGAEPESTEPKDVEFQNEGEQRDHHQ